MNKYQEALSKIIDGHHNDVIEQYYKSDMSKHKRDELYDKYKKEFKALQELVDQQKTYTEEEIKKMWKDAGYECVCDSENQLIFEEITENPFLEFSCNRVQILKNFKLFDTSYITKQNGKHKEYRLFMNFKIHQLLTKTFKWLGWEE